MLEIERHSYSIYQTLLVKSEFALVWSGPKLRITVSSAESVFIWVDLWPKQ